MEKVLDREKGPLSGFVVKPPYRFIVPRPWLGLVPEWVRRFLLPEFLLRTHVWAVNFNGESVYYKSQDAALVEFLRLTACPKCGGNDIIRERDALARGYCRSCGTWHDVADGHAKR